ncbi:MAG TPA: DUF262 domain-containing protein [Pseudonocardiaceae bacterium]|nr:DUF262 domain-containing protein [Pseudonocardiaceae bacterium]
MVETDTTTVEQEYFDNEPTGVEVEEQEYQLDVPWDPEKIRVATKQFSVRNILDLIDENGIELAPDFQRNRVWQLRQKSRLIESLLLQIPLPAFYFAETRDGVYRVVDGLQRLSTINSYARGDLAESFVLKDLEYLTKEAEGKRFNELSPQWRRRIHNTQLVVHVIDPTTPARVTFDIFKRINTGGTPLKAQEIRHCMSNTRSRSFLKECAELDEFQKATGGSLLHSVRMDDREAVLRFCAFRILGVEGYLAGGRRAMDAFLMDATQQLDDHAVVSDSDLAEVRNDFKRAMVNSLTVFGEHAFRKWSLATQHRNPINKPLFESWSVALADASPAMAEGNRESIARRARELMTDDFTYLDSISTGTGDPRKVEYRFDTARQAVLGK